MCAEWIYIEKGLIPSNPTGKHHTYTLKDSIQPHLALITTQCGAQKTWVPKRSVVILHA